MSVILRVDDFPGTKPEEFWKHKLDNFKKFDEVLERNGIQEYTLGVIPKYTTEEHIDWLASNPRIEVALHGIEHDERFPNEFRDHETEDDIYQKIVSASQPLARANGRGKLFRYIPPHNVVDLKTARALKRAGFTTLLGGPGSDERALDWIHENGILEVLYSKHPVWYGRSDEMMQGDIVRTILEPGYVGHQCLTLHWTWEWNIGLENLEKFLSQIGHVFK